MKSKGGAFDPPLAKKCVVAWCEPYVIEELNEWGCYTYDQKSLPNIIFFIENFIFIASKGLQQCDFHVNDFVTYNAWASETISNRCYKPGAPTHHMLTSINQQ